MSDRSRTHRRPVTAARRFRRRGGTARVRVRIWVDDDYDLCLNGMLVGSSTDRWAQLPGETYDVSSLLRQGDNVIALKLIDYGGQERGALFSLSIPGVPSARGLAGTGTAVDSSCGQSHTAQGLHRYSTGIEYSAPRSSVSSQPSRSPSYC